MIIHELIPIMKYLCRKYNKRNLLGKDLLDEVLFNSNIGKDRLNSWKTFSL
jgi:hypothetical protein